MLVNPVS